MVSTEHTARGGSARAVASRADRLARRRAYLVGLAFAALASGCGGGTTAAGTTTAPAAKCSAAGLSARLPAQDLPAPVEALRTRLAEAAVACDYAGLAAIARENPEGFSFSFGGATSPAAYWRRLENATADRPLARLVWILGLPVTRNEIGAYAWPSAYNERPTEADWDALAGLYPAEQLRQMQRQGSYLGYRTAISADGRWLFFVAGD